MAWEDLVHHRVASTDGENRRSFDAIESTTTVSLALIIAVKPPRRPLAPFLSLTRPQSRDRRQNASEHLPVRLV